MNINIKSGNYSCKECTERYVGCHSECEKYKKELAEWHERQRKVMDKKLKDVDVYLAAGQARERMKKRRGNLGNCKPYKR